MLDLSSAAGFFAFIARDIDMIFFISVMPIHLQNV